jgi:hypothetical protein
MAVCDFEHRSAELRGAIAPEELERIAFSNRGLRFPVPVAGTSLFAFDGDLIDRDEIAPPDDPVFGMAGFATYADIINAMSVLGKGQVLQYQKNSFTTVAQQVYDYWLAAGTPGAGAFGTALTGTIPTSATAGALPYVDPAGGAFMHLMSMWGLSTVALGSLYLYDRVAEYPFNGTVTSGTWGTQPALTRDAAGSSPGAGVAMFVENVGATANTAQTLNITYTNSAGTASRTTGAQTLQVGAISTNRVVNPTNAWWYPLQAGDSAVRSLQSYVLGASAISTTMNVVLARPLVILPVFATGAVTERDCVLQIPSLPRIYPSSALSFLLMAGTTTCPLNASLTVAEN